MKLFDKIREAWKTAMQSREEILGVEKGFPLDVSVGISPNKRPAKDGEFGDYYLSARYMGNDTWAVAEQYIEPEEMGTVFFEVENHGQMTTQDMMDKFDAEVGSLFRILLSPIILTPALSTVLLTCVKAVLPP